MVSIDDAQKIVLKETSILLFEEVSLLESLGRVIGEDVYAPWDIPMNDNSAMDGYAFSHEALKGNRLKLAGFVPAGVEQTVAISEGEGVKIMTGAPVPSGYDTVVPIEDVEINGDEILLTGKVKRGSHIRKQGEYVRCNELVLAAGSITRPQEIGMLVSLGKSSVKVYRKARVAILATGNELLDQGEAPVPGRIFNSNSYGLAAQVIEAGGEPVLLGIALDTRESTKEKIREGLQCDVLITTGGVSVGDLDFVKEVILELGGVMLFWKVNMKPGKPVAFAMLEGIPVFALPGNPVAAMVAFEEFVRPALLKMMGHVRIFRPAVRATVTGPVINKGNRPHLARGCVVMRKGKYCVTDVGNQDSANIKSLTNGNGLMKLPPEISLSPGEEIEVILLDREFEMGCCNDYSD